MKKRKQMFVPNKGTLYNQLNRGILSQRFGVALTLKVRDEITYELFTFDIDFRVSRGISTNPEELVEHALKKGPV